MLHSDSFKKIQETEKNINILNNEGDRCLVMHKLSEIHKSFKLFNRNT